MAVSRAPLAKLQAYKLRMGWTFPWASSFGGDFNADFGVGITEQQQREGGVEYNYRRNAHALDMAKVPAFLIEVAKGVGIDWVTYMR